MSKRVVIFEELIKTNRKALGNLLEEYTHIRGYHGCRPRTVKSYYQNGIVPIEEDMAKQEAMLRLKNKWNTEEKVRTVFEERWSKLISPDDSVWLTFSKEELINRCGHYLIYGSEFLCGMAADLGCQSILKKIGIPTVFCCDVPFDNIPEVYLKSIIQNIESRDGSGGFRVYDKILPSEIVDHIHPKYIADPLNGFIKYHYTV